MRHAVETYADLKSFRVPRSPLTKKVELERDRVLSDEEITKISTALATRVDWAEALFFFQLAVITGARMAELLRMRWEESDPYRGTVKLYSSKTNNDGGITHILTRRDHWFRKTLAYSTAKEYQADGALTICDTRA